MGLYLKAFRHRGAANESGWGVAWYEDGVAHVVKEARRADHSDLAEQLAAAPPRSSLFLVHVRAATVGRIAYENTHPFTAVVHGTHWTFAHNGTLDTAGLAEGRYEPMGDTDSEAAFSFVVAELDRLGARPSNRDVEDTVVEDTIVEIAAQLSARGRANFLLSDGDTLFAYYDGHKTLHHMTLAADDLRTVHVADDSDYVIDLEVEDAPHERAVILASVPLTDDERWEPVTPGALLICRDGTVRERVAVRDTVKTGIGTARRI